MVFAPRLQRLRFRVPDNDFSGANTFWEPFQFLPIGLRWPRGFRSAVAPATSAKNVVNMRVGAILLVPVGVDVVDAASWSRVRPLIVVFIVTL